MKVAGTLSPQLRTVLAGVMPDDGLAMRVQTVPINWKGETATAAVVIEVNRTALGQGHRNGGLRLEQGLLTINPSGKPANGVRRIFDACAEGTLLSWTPPRLIEAVRPAPDSRHRLPI